ncbi:probable chlorophyll(ide) b reductase NYC1, chloroplastic [Durio zibethinus]|uniref:chlorophyll(ide) b reductase n=1 Tax=Durio zibethinus TaxID=66656 RepID=A0A6P5ZRK8_DURZI|nr:probable chlorophyll(ide) b reductase NYC1, chloroplastic [Durio zibethinus]
MLLVITLFYCISKNLTGKINKLDNSEKTGRKRFFYSLPIKLERGTQAFNFLFQSLTKMAAVTEPHFCTFQRGQQFCFKEQNWLKRGCCVRLPVITRNRHRVYVQKCRSFRGEDGGEVEEKQMESERKQEILMENEVELEKGDGFWKSLKSAVFGVSKFGSQSQDEYEKAVAKVEGVFSSIAMQIGRYIVTMMSTGVILLIGFQLSGGDSQMDTLIWYSWVGGIIIGTMIGANMVLDEHCRAGPRNVVITGSTRGLGKALAREFLLSGDHVVVASRSPESVHMTVKELEENLKEGMTAGGPSSKNLGQAKVVGIACDVCDANDVKKLANFAINELGSVDIWINNAGTNKGFRPLLQFSDEDIRQIVSTNLVGSILCTREAMRIMKNQPKGVHIFNMDGAGSGGSSTPLTAVYGSTKCGLRQLHTSLLKECKRSKVGIHTASPGMVLTDLLLSGSTIKNKQMFNIICELPETVARSLVPRMRVVKGTGKAINYLTPPRILLALVTAWLRQGRWFDEQGRALYAAEADRIRNWAENRTRFSFTDAMEMYTENTWVSVFSLSVVFAFIILSSTGNTFPGT